MIFTPLSGDGRSTDAAPLAYVLQIDDVKILLDCGSPDWCPEILDSPPQWEQYCTNLKELCPSIDLVLFSHGDLAHIGLYVYAQSHWGLTAPAYASLPVQSLGKIAVTEEVESIRAEEQVDAETESGSKRIPTIKEVNAAFDALITLRYSQPAHLSGRCQGLTITPYAAGHTLGGTLWKLRSPSSGTIIYAVHLNHMKERHLDGTVLIKGGGSGGTGVFEPLARPDLLITDAERALLIVPRRKDRDAVLLETVTDTLQKGDSLLLPCDSSARLLELLVLLDQHWSYSRLRAPICLMSRTGREMLNLVRSLVEWMGGTIGKEDPNANSAATAAAADNNARNRRRRDDEDDDLGIIALRFRHLEFFTSPAALLQTYPSSTPKLILSVPSSLSHGPSRSLFTDFASVPGNTILLTTQGEQGTLSRILYDRWSDAQTGEPSKVGEILQVDNERMVLSMRSKVPLQGTELETHLAKERAAKEREAAQQAALTRTQRMLEADEGESDSDSDSDNSENEDENSVRDALMDGGAGEPEDHVPAVDSGGGGGNAGVDWSMLDTDDTPRTQQLSFDIYLKGNVSRTTSFFKPGGVGMGGAGGNGLTRFRMFPMVERKRKVDEYGESIDVAMWMRRGKALEEEKKFDVGMEEMEEDKDKQVEEEEVPSKFIREQVTVRLSCRILYVDMEGLNDSRAIKTIVPQVNPRKMIIVNASSDASDALISSCSTIRSMTKEIFTPVVGESITIGQQTSTFAISLSDSLLENVVMSRFEDNEVGYVNGKVSYNSGSSIPVLDPISESVRNADEDAMIVTETISITSNGTEKRPTPIRHEPALLARSTIIGDLKLTVLKGRLASLGIIAEFAGEGVLVCGGGGGDVTTQNLVAVKKTGRGQVVLEGAASDIYYVVRQEIYGLHAVIAA